MGGIGSGFEKRSYEGLADTVDRMVKPKAATMRKGDDMMVVGRWNTKKKDLANLLAKIARHG